MNAKFKIINAKIIKDLLSYGLYFDVLASCHLEGAERLRGLKRAGSSLAFHG
jgi:hypothetical protein